MKITILTLFPEMFESPFNYSIIKRAKERMLASINFINIRDFGKGPHKIVDDRPYGGGAGMVLRVDVLEKALESAILQCRSKNKCREKVILLDPQGKTFNQKIAQRLSKYDHLILICARYEGIDERIRKIVDEEISIGDYVLTGGELPAMVLTDAILRLVPKVLGKDASSKTESFQKIKIDGKNVAILEYPQYTRPQIYKNLRVPKILLSGDHKKIAGWRQNLALKRTEKRRPDLLKGT